MANLLLEKCLQ